MRVSLDTSIIINIERGNQEVIKLLDELVLDDANYVFISSVVLSEIFTGTYLRADYKKAVKKAKELFSLFEVVPLDAEIAEIIGEINAYLIANGLPIEYQDVAIAATFLSKKGEYLLTENVEHFSRIPELKKRVLRPGEFKNRA
ncbi:MAG: type II toxin-antitoxin system VapC family toxin [Candidatus Hydrothermarchaeaceae archaeon]